MNKLIYNIAKTALAAALVVGLMPTAAFAAGTSVSDSGSFTLSDDRKSATAETNVYVAVIGNDFAICEILPVPSASNLSTEGIGVRVTNGIAPYSAEWHRQKLVDGQWVNDPVTDNGKVGVSHTTGDSDTLKWYPGTQPIDKLDEDTSYRYWAVLSDSANPANTITMNPQESIEITTESRYSYSKKTSGIHTVEGDLVRADTEFSASEASSDIYAQMNAAATKSNNAIADEKAWQLGLIVLNDPENHDAFKGTLSGRIDVTDVVKNLVSDGTCATENEAISKLGLLWCVPNNSSTVVDVAKNTAENANGAPYNMRVIAGEGEDSGKYFVSYTIGSSLVGHTGQLGAFAVTIPVIKMFDIVASASAGGQIDPVGTMCEAEGSTPAFNLRANKDYKLVSVVVTVYDTNNRPTANTVKVSEEIEGVGKLSGNMFTMAPLGGPNIVRYEVHANFEVIPEVQERDYVATLAVDRTSTDTTDTRTSVALVGKGVVVNGGSSNFTVSSNEIPTLSFVTADGWAVDQVIVTYPGTSLEGIVYDRPSSTLEMQPLLGNANIRVTYYETLQPAPIVRHKVEAAVADVPANAGTATVSGGTSEGVEHDEAATFTASPATYFDVLKADVYYGTEDANGAVIWDNSPTDTYQAASLQGSGNVKSLTISHILRPTRVVFSFIEKSTTLTIPTSVEHATISVSGASGVAPNFTITHGQPVSITVVVEDGYELIPGALQLVSANGEIKQNIAFTKTSEHTYTTTNPVQYGYVVSTVGENASVICTPTHIPIVIDPTPDQPADTVVNKDDEGTKIETKPSGSNQVTGDVKVDDIVIVDENGTEIKDKLTETDSDGNKYSPDYPGIKYDPDGGKDGNGEYVIDNPDGTQSRFEFDSSTGEIVFNEIGGDNTHKVESTSTSATTVNLEVKLAGSTDTTQAVGGKVIPSGRLKWKDGYDMPIVAIPDSGYEVSQLFVGNEEVDMIDATSQHVADAQEAYRTALTWSGVSQEQALETLSDAMVMSTATTKQNTNVQNAIAVVTGAETAWADEEVPLGAKAYVIPGSKFDTSKGDVYLEVTPVFREINSPSIPVSEHIITAEVKGGHGQISGEAVRSVADGADCTVSFLPDMGYRVAYVTIDDGERKAQTERSYTFTNVTSDHKIVVEFAALGYSGDNSGTTRTIKTVNALAKTGDLNAPGMMILLSIAFAASGFAVISSSRSRRAKGGRHAA